MAKKKPTPKRKQQPVKIFSSKKPVPLQDWLKGKNSPRK
jgi:hypothetical protein